jgi:hypothetical protein
MKRRMKQNPSGRNVEQCNSTIKGTGTEQNSNAKPLMQIFLLLQTYLYHAIIIIIIIVLILFLLEPHCLSTYSVNLNFTDKLTNLHIVTIFLILYWRIIFHTVSSYDVIYLENQFKMPRVNIVLSVAIKAENKGNFHKFVFCITFWTKITLKNVLIIPISFAIL